MSYYSRFQVCINMPVCRDKFVVTVITGNNRSVSCLRSDVGKGSSSHLIITDLHINIYLCLATGRITQSYME